MQYDIDKIGILRYNILRAEIFRCEKTRIFIGVWLSLVECLVRDQEAGGSNPLTPTKKTKAGSLRFLLQEDLNGAGVNDSLRWLSEPRRPSGDEPREFKSSHSDQKDEGGKKQKTSTVSAFFAFFFSLMSMKFCSKKCVFVM